LAVGLKPSQQSSRYGFDKQDLNTALRGFDYGSIKGTPNSISKVGVSQSDEEYFTQAVAFSTQ
jgi:hypothetical protein